MAETPRRHHPLEALTTRRAAVFLYMETKEVKREQVIQMVAEMLRHNAFSVEFKVKKKPAGIRIIYETTQEELDRMSKINAEKKD